MKHTKAIQSQEKQILIHLKQGKTINPLQALKEFGCFRLSARIKDIRDNGYTIISKVISDGVKRFAEYKLIRAKKK